MILKIFNENLERKWIFFLRTRFVNEVNFEVMSNSEANGYFFRLFLRARNRNSNK